jgi:hypothetical protein
MRAYEQYRGYEEQNFQKYGKTAGPTQQDYKHMK